MHDEPYGDTEPVTLNLRWPAEWEPHERTLMAWPSRPDRWGEYLEWARRDVVEIANTIAQFEPVTMVVRPGSGADASRRLGPRVEVVELAIDDSWIRDNGPVIMRDDTGARVGLHFQFNAWGNRFHPYMADAAVAELVLQRLGIPRMLAPFVLENSSVSGNGAGTIVTTAQCNLDPNRNGDVSAAHVEGQIKQWMGASRVVWLPRGLAEDSETDGHVDNVAMFAPDETVLVQTVASERNPNYGSLLENKRLFEKFGFRTLAIDHLPYSELGSKVSPVPYVNLYVCNGAVIVPVTGFDGGADAAALAVIGEAFPGRTVVGVPGAVLAYGGGGVHRMTMQVPTFDGNPPPPMTGRSEASEPGELRSSDVITVRSAAVTAASGGGGGGGAGSGRTLRVGVIQHEHHPDPATLRAQLAEFVEHAVKEGAELVCLPELFMEPVTGLFPDGPPHTAGEPFPLGPTHEFMIDLARHTRTVIAGSIHTAAPLGGRGDNMSVIVDASGDTIWAMPRLHSPRHGDLRDDSWFRVGGAPADPVSVGSVKIAQPVGWDAWFPELARVYRLRGAEVLLYPSSIGSGRLPNDLDTVTLWERSIVAHAIANGMFVIAANRVGVETHGDASVTSRGSSFVADPYGRILVRALSDRACVMIADLDLDTGAKAAEHLPFLAGRRPELYGEISADQG